jgi:hypothetical protein
MALPNGLRIQFIFFFTIVIKKRSSQKPKKMNLRGCEWQVDSLLLQR